MQWRDFKPYWKSNWQYHVQRWGIIGSDVHLVVEILMASQHKNINNFKALIYDSYLNLLHFKNVYFFSYEYGHVLWLIIIIWWIICHEITNKMQIFRSNLRNNVAYHYQSVAKSEWQLLWQESPVLRFENKNMKLSYHLPRQTKSFGFIELWPFPKLEQPKLKLWQHTNTDRTKTFVIFQRQLSL